jgi:toxin ParE1/3/4
MSSKRRVHRLTALAEADLEEIWQYSFRRWSPEQAEEYVRGIMTAIEGLASGQITGRQNGVRDGCWKYKIGSHFLYFHYSDEYLDVLRVLHERMDVERRLIVSE